MVFTLEVSQKGTDIDIPNDFFKHTNNNGFSLMHWQFGIVLLKIHREQSFGESTYQVRGHTIQKGMAVHF